MQNVHLIAARNTLLLILGVATTVGLIFSLAKLHPLILVVLSVMLMIAVIYGFFLLAARDDRSIHKSAASAERWVERNLKD